MWSQWKVQFTSRRWCVRQIVAPQHGAWIMKATFTLVSEAVEFWSGVEVKECLYSSKHWGHIWGYCIYKFWCLCHKNNIFHTPSPITPLKNVPVTSSPRQLPTSGLLMSTNFQFPFCNKSCYNIMSVSDYLYKRAIILGYVSTFLLICLFYYLIY